MSLTPELPEVKVGTSFREDIDGVWLQQGGSDVHIYSKDDTYVVIGHNAFRNITHTNIALIFTKDNEILLQTGDGKNADTVKTTKLDPKVVHHYLLTLLQDVSRLTRQDEAAKIEPAMATPAP